MPVLGLTQRTMLLLVVAVSGSLAVLAAGFAMQRQDDFADFTDAYARSTAAQVQSARLMLQSVSKADRHRISAGLKTSGTVQVFAASDTHPPADEVATTEPVPRSLLQNLFGQASPAVPEVSQALARYATAPAEVHYVQRPGPGYWVSQVIDGETWWIVVLAGRPPPSGSGVPWPAVAAVLLGLLTVAALFAATISRPLRKLAIATHRIGDNWPEPVKINGPVELRDLAESFNAMLVRLRQIENERRVLLGGLPHDLRAPLTRLRLRLEMIADLAEHPGVAGDIESIDRIVRQFTHYLRGVQPDEPLVPLGELAREAVDAYRGVGHQVTLQCGDGARAMLPQFAIRRLLDNLIGNALQHGNEPVDVRVGTVASGAVELAVTDHGAGIPPEAAETALEPFTKLDSARGGGGAGLGLAIVRQLTRQLGGTVRFERQPNSFSVVARLGVEWTLSAQFKP